METKKIKDFDYYIDTLGNVYNESGKTLSQSIDNKVNLLKVTLYKGGTPYKKNIHRLVAETFIDNPNNFTIVRHIDGNTLNNNIDNLMWVKREMYKK